MLAKRKKEPITAHPSRAFRELCFGYWYTNFFLLQTFDFLLLFAATYFRR